MGVCVREGDNEKLDNEGNKKVTESFYYSQSTNYNFIELAYITWP